ncbi:hypothetical protein VTO42DRAFT_6062 [Malbranchea cinnamomea]
MSDNKASKLVSCERPEKLCQESNDDPLNLERMSPSCSDDEEDENIPLMEVRRMALAPVKRGNDGTTVAHQAPVGNTFLRNSVGALVPTSAGVNATSGHPVPLNNDVDPRHAEKEVDMRQAHASVASAIARVAPNVGPMGYTAPPSDPVDSLWNMQHPDALHAALRRAEMITRHWLRIPPQQPASDNSSEPHPRTSFTRYTCLSEPDYGHISMQASGTTTPHN